MNKQGTTSTPATGNAKEMVFHVLFMIESFLPTLTPLETIVKNLELGYLPTVDSIA